MKSTWQSFYTKLVDATGIGAEECRCAECVDEKLTEAIVEATLLEEFKFLTRIPMVHDPRSTFCTRPIYREIRTKRAINHLYNEIQQIYQGYLYFKNDTKQASFICECCGCPGITKKHKTFPEKDICRGSAYSTPVTLVMCNRCVQRIQTCSDCGSVKYGNAISAIHKTKEAYQLFQERRNHRDPIHEDTRWVCRECIQSGNEVYAKCTYCGCTVEKERIHEVPFARDYNDIVIYSRFCDLCEDQAKFICDVCGKASHGIAQYMDLREDGFYLKGVELKSYEQVCTTCYQHARNIQGHQYKPIEYNFHWGKDEKTHTPETMTFGYELEVEMGPDSIGPGGMAKKVAMKYDKTDFYVVHDGSINNGIEIVGHPFSWAYFKENQKEIKDLLAFCAKYGYNTDGPKVGFHVHTNKDAWESYHVYKVMKFMYDNTNRKFLNWMAGRKPTEHCFYADAERDNLEKVAELKKNYTSQHYNAVNLNGEHTIEFRIFCGSMVPEVLFKYIEFTKAIHAFTLTAEPHNLKAMQFRQFVRNNTEEYPNLAKAINEQYKK